MQRFSSLIHAPAETRRLLRDRLPRFLPSHGNSPRFVNDGTVMLSDEVALRLMLALSIEHADDLETMRAKYQAALPTGISEPTFEAIIRDGWFRMVWGRAYAPYEIFRNVQADAGLSALSSVMASRHGATYALTSAARDNPDFADVVSAVNTNTIRPGEIGCRTPAWVAARLWERTWENSPTPEIALREWIDRWKLLDHPPLVPAQAWGRQDADVFRSAALQVLTSSDSTLAPKEMRARLVIQMALASSRQASEFEPAVKEIPESLVDRALWFEDPQLQRVTMWTMEACGDLFSLIRLLLADAEAEDNAQAPHKTARVVFELAGKFPELIYLLLIVVRDNPTLLVDLLLHPPTSALACLQIAQWRSKGGGWDRLLLDRDDELTKGLAFADAASVMAYFLNQETIEPKEVAALYRWLFARTRPRFMGRLPSADAMLATLRDELAHQLPPTTTAIVDGIVTSISSSGLADPAYAAAVDIIDACQLAGTTDPTRLVELYIESLNAGDYGLSAGQITSSGATALVALARRATPQMLNRFLAPLDVKARLAATRAADENPYTVNSDIARSIRVHVRILCRAVAGSIDAPLNDLIDALIVTVRMGAINHEEKGRIGAFSASNDITIYDVQRDRPIAADLGAALGALSDDPRANLLKAILETDEPLILASLLDFAPLAVKDQIRQRIDELTPAISADVHSLPEVLARIDKLLSAGMADAAERFIKFEHDLQTLGKPPGREVARMRAELRLKLLRRDWAGIAATQKPVGLTPAEDSTAQETLDFFQALAMLSNPEADRDASVQKFAQLHNKRPEVAGYAINYFAAQITRLLRIDMFAQLQNADLARARQLLLDSEVMMRRVSETQQSELEIFTCNKALLLLAVGEPERAGELLASISGGRQSENAAAYNAVALARRGRTHEALVVLAQAKQILGNSEVLQAAAAHINSGQAYQGVVSVTDEDNPVLRIKAALHDLKQMDHHRQAEVLHPETNGFIGYTIGQVRSAAASVTALVPMMKHIEVDSCEDDITALIRELLISRLLLVGWSFPDQSKGGYSAKANPGERDLLLLKDSTVLSAIEAVVYEKGGAKKPLTTHFQKLFGYADCQLYFHLTYAYGDNLTSLIEFLKKTSKEDVPEGYVWLSFEDLSPGGSQPSGFLARYKQDGADISMVFLVLNMGQVSQRNAAKVAAQVKPKAAPKKSLVKSKPTPAQNRTRPSNK